MHYCIILSTGYRLKEYTVILSYLSLSSSSSLFGKSPDMFLKRKATSLTCSPFPTPSSTSPMGILISAFSPPIRDTLSSVVSFNDTSST